MSLEDAACRGMHELFDSTQAADHLVAREVCGDCPIRLRCLQEARTAIAPNGTWGGRLFISDGEAPRPGHTGRRPNAREHGSERGYQQHKTNSEDACADCKGAHAAHVWMRYGKAAV